MNETRHLVINGGQTTGRAGEREVLNPFDGSVVGCVSYADSSQMTEAVKAAHDAFSAFRKTPSHERSAILQKASEGLRARREEIARLISQESGKPISYARIEVDRGAFTFASAAEAARHAGDGVVIDMSASPQSAGRTASYRRFPIGVIAAITPFNFPLNLVAHKVAPAIAAGNTIVLKPAPQTPLTAFVLADILSEAGLPPGVLNVVPCENSIAEELVRNPLVKMISFTGSDAVGWRIKQMAGMARVALELGGNGSVIVDEVSDWDWTLKTLGTAAFNYAGQICISLQTLLVKRQHFDEMLERMIDFANSAKVGDQLSDETIVGPMISSQAADKVSTWIDEAVAAGAVRHTGKRNAPTMLTPTVMTDVPKSCTLWTSEAFAPVLIIEPYDDIDDAIAIVNESKYGLQAGLFSNDIRTINKVYESLEVGGLIVNESNAFRLDTMPYGGVKNSGLGREGIRYAMEEMSEIKMLVMKA